MFYIDAYLCFPGRDIGICIEINRAKFSQERKD